MPNYSLQSTTKELFLRFPIHSFFLSAYPIVSLLAFNIDQIYAKDAFRSLIIAISVTAIILAGLMLLSKNWQLTGLLTSLLVVWFFLYGRLYDPLKSISIFGFILGRHRYLLLAWSGIIMAIACWLVKRFRFAEELTKVLNVFSTVLICLPIIQISAYHLRNFTNPSTPMTSSITQHISWTDDAIPPDIYYIILDGYTRSDALEQEFGIDNSVFLEELQQLGFYIADCAQSNYTRTRLSLTSTFNMEYLQTLEQEIAPDQELAWLLPYLKDNMVRRQLEGLGYKTIVFKHSWGRLIWDDAAIVYSSSGTGLMSPFEYLFLRTTLARAYLDLRQSENNQLSNFTNYDDTLYALKQLSKVPDILGPKFVFAHLIIPHPPFVFGPNGEKIDIPYDNVTGNIYSEENYKLGYSAGVSYINKRMLEIIPQLINASKTPPIIILAGDHGTPWGGWQNAVKILNAYYTPGSQSPFYETITPVNTFRVVFDTFFNGNFGLLSDRSYFSDEDRYSNLQELPSGCDPMD